jgi:hypothetical protein
MRLSIRRLIHDTLRQAAASGVCWLMLGVSGLCIAVCLTIRPVSGADVEGPGAWSVPPPPERVIREGQGAAADLVATCSLPSRGVWWLPLALISSGFRELLQRPPETAPAEWTRVELLFGLVSLDVQGDTSTAVRALQVRLAGWVADGVGLLLALLWTAAFLPTFLDAGAITVFLVKPVPRWLLLAGKCLGILVFLAGQAGIFVAGTWAAIGLRTGVWEPRYFLILPLLLLHFSVFFSFSAMLAVVTRSTVACVFGSMVFWLLCWATNLGRHAFLSLPAAQRMPEAGRGIEFAYWLLPKPLDAHLLLSEAMRANTLLPGVIDLTRLIESGTWHPAASLLATAAAAIVLFAVSAYEFVTADY